ncbi:MAG: RNA polymerase sigma factor [Bacteroidetes bacterium]|nr:RNA polymerase sigma factor [Bacteroidota bacterium]
MNEQHLVEELRNQDEKATRFFIQTYQHDVFRVILKIVFNEMDAEDLTQETFMDALVHIRDFQSDSSLKTWLFRIAVNRSLQHLRACKRKKRFAVLKSIFATESEEPIAIPDPSASISKKIENDELSKALQLNIEKLPENQRLAFSLIYLNGHTYQETASIMDVSVKAIEALLSRAKLKLRKSLGEFHYETT